jgi:signal transduction histidine kinase
MAEADPSLAKSSADTELLQALAHEVRTPLTTIRTLTRLLLKRKDLNPDVIKRLEVIDRECTEQIDRFSLIFRAVELQTTETKQALMPLAPISLAQVIQQNLTRWQQQASQYSHTLDILVPQKLPMVVTDPVMLDQALTGLIDRITHRLPPGSHIQVQVALAGHQLKLQFLSHPQATVTVSCHKDKNPKDGKAKIGFAPAVRSIGQLLMFQPETGNLSLSLSVTKNLFQALGGKMTVREHPQEGEVLTIFLPLETRKSEE